MDCYYEKLLSEIYNKEGLSEKGRKLAIEKVQALALIDHLNGEEVSPKALPPLPFNHA